MLLNQAFLEVPTDKVHLWVDSIYVVMTTPAIAASPVLFKQVRKSEPVFILLQCSETRPR